MSMKRKTTLLFNEEILQWLMQHILNVNICESKQRTMYILMDVKC